MMFLRNHCVTLLEGDVSPGNHCAHSHGSFVSVIHVTCLLGKWEVLTQGSASLLKAVIQSYVVAVIQAFW